MGKRESGNGSVAVAVTAEETALQIARPEVSAASMAIMEVPLGDVTDKEYLTDHVESRLSSVSQRRAFRRLTRGLQQTGAKTLDGRAVTRPGDVVRWLMEQIE